MVNKLVSGVLTIVLSLGFVGVVQGQGVSAMDDNPGNNGTIKVDRLEFDSTPGNQPKVGCTFEVDFFNYGKDVGNATVNFELQAPTKDGRTLAVTSGNLSPNIGQDAPGGGTDVDAQEEYTLAFTGEPHPVQGYHVKLTINAPESNGNDTKSKVFFVSGCDDEEEEEPIPSSAVSLVCPVNKYKLTITNTGETELDVEINGKSTAVAVATSTTADFNVGDTLTVKIDGVVANVEGKVLNNFKLVTCQGMGTQTGTNSTNPPASTVTSMNAPATTISSGFGAGAANGVASLPVTSGSASQLASVLALFGSIIAAAGTYAVRTRSGFSI